ncbi:ABC transporter substrate-binding protein [Cupriavidus necator]
MPRHKRFLLHTLSCVSVVGAVLGIVPAAHAQTVIGIANLGPHPSISQTIAGFKEEMARSGYVEGKNTTYVYGDANFTQALMPQMLTQIASRKPAFILTLTTSVSQTALSAVADRKLPMVFAMVTDPVAAGLVEGWDHGSSRFVGASDIQDFDAVLIFAKKLFPNAKSFGTLYNPGEANDVTTTRKLEEASRRAGLTFKAISVDTTADIPQRAEMLRGTDFMYATGSNLVQSAMPAVASVTNRLKVPILSSETEFVKSGIAAANYAVSLRSIGVNAATLATRVLKGAAPAALPVLTPSPNDYVSTINTTKFKQLGLTIPPAMESCQCFIN